MWHIVCVDSQGAGPPTEFSMRQKDNRGNTVCQVSCMQASVIAVVHCNSWLFCCILRSFGLRFISGISMCVCVLCDTFSFTVFPVFLASK